MANPISADKTVLRHTLLVNMLENAMTNTRFTPEQQVFEIGSVYYKHADGELPEEPHRLAILMTGPRAKAEWMGDAASGNVDFFDLKGVIAGLLDGLHIDDLTYERAKHPSLHPGRSATIKVDEETVGDFGELHPLVARAFDLTDYPVLIAELDLEQIMALTPVNHLLKDIPNTPPVLEDIALVVPEDTEAAAIEKVIWEAGGDLLRAVTLFDVYQGDSIEAGHKSLAYSLVYQAMDRTLTDKQATKLRNKIIKSVEKRTGAKLRA